MGLQLVTAILPAHFTANSMSTETHGEYCFLHTNAKDRNISVFFMGNFQTTKFHGESCFLTTTTGNSKISAFYPT